MNIIKRTVSILVKNVTLYLSIKLFDNFVLYRVDKPIIMASAPYFLFV